MRLDDDSGASNKRSDRPSENQSGNGKTRSNGNPRNPREKAVGNTAMADAFARLKR